MIIGDKYDLLIDPRLYGFQIPGFIGAGPYLSTYISPS
jgi:hypothetical protein